MVHSSEWLVIAVTSALAAICWSRDARWIAFLLFLSSVVYFLPSVVMLFDGSTLEEISALRNSGTTNLIKVLAVATVMIGILLLKRSAWSKTLLRPLPLLLSSALLIGMFTLDTPMDQQRAFNTLSLIGMLLLVTAGANSLEQDMPIWKKPDRSTDFFIVYLWLLLLLAVVVAVYEISSSLAWARFNTANQLLVVRASSLFFNPNLFGLFCAMLASVFAFRWHMTFEVRPHPALLSGIFLAGLGIYLASSRGLGYLLLIFFLATSMLLPPGTHGRFKPTLVYVFSILLSATLSLLWWRMDSRAAAEHFWVLALRLLDSPVQILAICLNVLGVPLWGQMGELVLKPETIVAVEGRFLGGQRDSGLLTAYDDSGWLGIAAILAFWLYTLWFGVRAYAHHRSVQAAYALATVGFCFAIGVLMRYQVYPVWIWVALMLAPCFAYWRIQAQTCGALTRAYP